MDTPKQGLFFVTVGLGLVLFCCVNLFAENIDPYDDGSQYAWGENIGWVNFEPNVPEPNAGAQVAGDEVTGFVWAENIGWISLSCENTSSCGAVDYGVVNDGTGKLSGYAWAENVGWINFDPNVPADANHYGVAIDEDGNFDGWAYGENIGWVHFRSAGPVAYGVRVCLVTLDDLANFVDDWLVSGGGIPADLSGDSNVDFEDYGMFAWWWRDYCPAGWQLK